MLSFVFVHGTRSSNKIWEKQMRAVQALGFKAVALDLPGHGLKQNEKFSLEKSLKVINESVSELDNVILVGLSLGGYLSLAYAKNNPEKLKGLILTSCATEIKGKPLLAYRNVSEIIAKKINPETSWGTVSDMLTSLHGYEVLKDLKIVKEQTPTFLINGSRDVLRFGERAFLKTGVKQYIIPKAGHDVSIENPIEYNRVLFKIIFENFQ